MKFTYKELERIYLALNAEGWQLRYELDELSWNSDTPEYKLKAKRSDITAVNKLLNKVSKEL